MRLFSALAVGTFGATLIAWSPAVVPALAQVPAQAPFKAGKHYFFFSTDGALNVRDNLHGNARMLLQPRAFETLAPSWNGQYIAYGMPSYGKRSYDVLVLNVSTDRVFPEVLHNARITRAPWTANNKGFLYTRVDTVEHRERIYYHTLGQPQERDQIVYSRQDELDWGYDARVSDDGQYAVFTVSHPQDDHTRIYFIDLDNPGKPSLDAPVVKLMDDFQARYEFVDNGGDSFFLLTYDEAPRGRIVLANTDVTRASRWPTVWDQLSDSASLGDTLQFARTAGEDYVVAVYRNGNKSVAHILTLPPARVTHPVVHSMNRPDGIYPRVNGERIGDDSTAMRGLQPAIAAWRLQRKRSIDIAPGSTIVDMRSVADDPELFYTVKRPDGALVSFIYDVTNGAMMPYDTNTGARVAAH